MASTTTNSNGVYRFYGVIANESHELIISPFQNYFVRFRFNGQLYQQTRYDDSKRIAPWPGSDGIGSSATEEGRLKFNERFETIESDRSGNSGKDEAYNYKSYTDDIDGEAVNTGKWSKAYSIYHKIENSDEQYISYSGGKYVKGTLTYGDVWDKFVKYALNSSNWDERTRSSNDYQEAWTGVDERCILFNPEGHGLGGKAPYKNPLSSDDDANEYYIEDTSYKIAFNALGNELKDYNISNSEWKYIKRFIRDCMLTSTTHTTFVVPEKVTSINYGEYYGYCFIINNVENAESAGEKDLELNNSAWREAKNLYTKTSDQARYVDYGITLRNTNDITIQKDVFKVTTLVDGEKEEYDYRSKNVTRDAAGWQIGLERFRSYIGDGERRTPVNAVDENGSGTRRNDDYQAGNRYDGTFVHPLEVRRSDYAENYGNDDDKRNMQVFITYRIGILNEGSYRVYINELADYYDVDEMDFDGERNDDGTLRVTDNKYTNKRYKEYNNDGDESKTYVNSYIGKDRKGTPLNASDMDDLTVTTKDGSRNGRQLTGNNYNYDTIFITSKNRGYNDYNDNTIKNIQGKAYLDSAEDAESWETPNSGIEDQSITSNQAFVYVTFKVKNAALTSLGNGDIKNKIRLDQSLINGEYKLGKRNIIEVNSYKTTYGKSYRNFNEIIDRNLTGKPAGLIDMDSNPGSLKEKDLDDTDAKGGSIIVDNDNAKDRQQDDTDAAPPIRIIIDENNNDTRVFSGMAFEDARTENSANAIIGDGKKNDNETPIDGVTMELYKLDRKVDENGIFIGKYNEDIPPIKMEQKVYSIVDQPNAEIGYTINYSRYKTGTGNMKTVLNAEAKSSDGSVVYDDSPLTVKEGNIPYEGYESLLRYLQENPNGKYAFVSIPEGDYFIRFKYGDTTDTVLMRNKVGDGSTINNEISNNRVNEVLKRSIDNRTETVSTGIGSEYAKDIVYGNSGLNYKSYNGQDYKSTIYQADIDQNGQNYYKITGYTNIEDQNYSTSGDTEDGLSKNVEDTKGILYYYDITRSEAQQSSDAKDVYYYRNRADSYGRGELAGISSQRNTLAETLSSFEKLATYTEMPTNEDANGDGKIDDDINGNGIIDSNDMELMSSQRQWAMVKELINNTNMVAQTGVISTKGEKDTKYTNWNGNTEFGYENSTGLVNNNNGLTQDSKYSLKNIDLGLQERPESQLKLTKKISNFSVILANGQTLFNTDKTVRNLYLKEHEGHKTFFVKQDNDNPAYNEFKNGLKTITSNIDKTGKSGSVLRGKAENLYGGSAVRRLAAVVTSANSTETPELLQLYMDDELMEGAQIGVRYTLEVENVGEVDYKDKKFYYNGQEDSRDANIVKTNATEVVDYVSNMIKYDQAYQQEGVIWQAKTLTELINSVKNSSDNGYTESSGTIFKEEDPNGHGIDYDKIVVRNDGPANTINDAMRWDFVNRAYADIAKTYNTILMTENLAGDLIPIKYYDNENDAKKDGRKDTTLVLATQISTNNTGDNLVYNNLAEIVETKNTVGRRMKYSIIGNQRMADQSQGNDADLGTSSQALITPGKLARDEVSPTEIDADSAQKIIITKPTGENRNYDIIIMASIAALALISAGALFVKKAFKM